MQETIQLWQNVCAALKHHVSGPMYCTWVEPVEPVAFAENRLTLQVPSDFHRSQLLRFCGTVLPDLVEGVFGPGVALVFSLADAPLNNLNLNNSRDSLKASGFTPQASGESTPPNSLNLNNLKPAPKRGGVPRLELYRDGILSKAMDWGVEEWFVQVCIREYGLDRVKREISRLHNIPESYFKPQYGPINGQRGRFFNKEMQKLKAARAAG